MIYLSVNSSLSTTRSVYSYCSILEDYTQTMLKAQTAALGFTMVMYDSPIPPLYSSSQVSALAPVTYLDELSICLRPLYLTSVQVL